MASDNFHGTYSHDRGQWKLQREGAARATGYFATADELNAAGRAAASRNGGEYLKHRKSDGQIHMRNSYGPDPYPPKG